MERGNFSLGSMLSRPMREGRATFPHIDAISIGVLNSGEATREKNLLSTLRAT